ncbi:uncharacterized protein LOC112565853 isoform X3 [Pomacea canaliculata]|uniref:uncharacterized protein LOC112565853 isoform X3 n=1 Tax=Pomacea canaliculata TaxID=400727 RepID=UPI000D726724|nr:uncharacterized protein LOC112565853 isoform X3 [Pomacea canaliculata]
MEVVNLPSDKDSSGNVTKNLLQGRQLPTVLMDTHPDASSYSCFRPPQPRHSLKYSNLKETDSTDHVSGILFSPLANDPSCQLVDDKLPDNNRSKSRSQKIKRHPSSILQLSSSSPAVTSHTSEQTYHGHTFKVNKIGQHGRNMYMDGPDYLVNPEPAPFTPQNFLHYHGLLPFPRSSTVLKRIPYSKRHQDMFGGSENNGTNQRGVILHTDRYAKFELPKGFESISLNQRDRLLAEMEYIEYLRGIRRRRELVPHRAELDLFMGGRKIEFEERFDLNREIQKLKSMAMPVKARDLFHGRGIQLPETHMSLKPRPVLDNHLNNGDIDDDVRSSAPSSLLRPPQSLMQDFDMAAFQRGISLSLVGMPQIRTAPRSHRFGPLPSIRNRTGIGFHHDGTSLSQSQSTIPQPGRSAASWVHEQRKFLMRRQGTNQIETDVTAEDKEHLPPAPPPTAGGTTTAGKKSNPLNPLKRGVELSVPEEQISNLRQTFQRLDTDKDGHLQYDQLRSQLPKEFSKEQEYFVKQVYELTSRDSFFGVDEFLMMSQLTERVAGLIGKAAEAYGSLDFDTLGDFIMKYVDQFQVHDSSQRGHITLGALREVLSQATGKIMDDGSPDWEKVMDSISLDYGTQVNKIDYLAHIPLFITMEGGQKQ